jgi:hypothetical protein
MTRFVFSAIALIVSMLYILQDGAQRIAAGFHRPTIMQHVSAIVCHADKCEKIDLVGNEILDEQAILLADQQRYGR